MGVFRRMRWENKFKKANQHLSDLMDEYKVEIITNNVCTAYTVKPVSIIPIDLLKEIDKFMQSKGYYPKEEIRDKLLEGVLYD